MSNKVKISEVLHLAADKYLASDYEEYIDTAKWRFSCCAVGSAIDNLVHDVTYNNTLRDNIQSNFESLGLESYTITAFEEFEKGIVPEESQGARYLWLKFCAMLAEEQGE